MFCSRSSCFSPKLRLKIKTQAQTPKSPNRKIFNYRLCNREEMCSSSSRNPSFLFTTDAPIFLRRRFNPSFFVFPSLSSSNFSPKPRKFLRLSASADDSRLTSRSWFDRELHSDEDRYRGWFVVDTRREHRKTKKGVRIAVVGGVGFAAVLFATLAYFSISRKGFKIKLSSPLHSLRGVLSRNEADKLEDKDVVVSRDESLISEASKDEIPDVDETHSSASSEKLERILLPVAADPTQQEALFILKKLKIIEGDVRADELCTRREYARWLVYINSLLESNPRHRIVPSVALAGSVIAAFDDVRTEDPDFEPIQALAEAGIIPSKLSEKYSFSFYPERFISRLDLINWKAQLEYEFMAHITDGISRTKVDYMDMKETDPNVVPGLFTDMLTGEKSMLRKVFGQIKRFQPNKPSTKAQAAVALTCGRMSQAISAEFLRIEAENSSRQAAIEEVRSELVEKGDIKRFWDEKLHELHIRGLEMEEHYVSATRELEQKKIVQEKWFAEHLKEKSAIDCQKQLLRRLKEEVNEMSERLVSEREMHVIEQRETKDMLIDLQFKLESVLDSKSVLEAEIEALRILRSWVEDEAKKSQARAMVLKEVGRRWKWDDQS